MTNTDKDMREAFEVEFADAMRRKNHPWWQCISDAAFRRNKLTDEYILDQIQMGFVGYQAAHAASEKRIAELEQEVSLLEEAVGGREAHLQADNQLLVKLIRVLIKLIEKVNKGEFREARALHKTIFGEIDKALASSESKPNWELDPDSDKEWQAALENLDARNQKGGKQ